MSNSVRPLLAALEILLCAQESNIDQGIACTMCTDWQVAGRVLVGMPCLGSVQCPSLPAYLLGTSPRAWLQAAKGKSCASQSSGSAHCYGLAGCELHSWWLLAPQAMASHGHALSRLSWPVWSKDGTSRCECAVSCRYNGMKLLDVFMLCSSRLHASALIGGSGVVSCTITCRA